jgi:WD40-like Beta Propeller Repeat
MRANGADVRQLVAPRGAYPDTGGLVGAPTWTHDSKQFAYPLSDSVHIVDVATGSDRAADEQDLLRIRWRPSAVLSPKRRWVANTQSNGVILFRAKDGHLSAKFPHAVAAAWSPNGKWLALESRDGIRVLNIRTRHLRMLTRDISLGLPPVTYQRELFFGFAWAPDGRSITYVPGSELTGSGSWSIVTGGLQTVTLTGKKRTVVSTSHAYGGRMTAVAWTRTPASLQYGAPDATPPEPVSSTSVLAGGRIELLAAEGAHVAFEACNRIFVWTPSASSIDPVEPSTTTTSSCGYPETTGRYFRYDLALAGNRLAYALNDGCNSIEVSLHLSTIGPLTGDDQIANGWGNCGGPFHPAVGRLAGSGDLLVYGEWTETAIAYPLRHHFTSPRPTPPFGAWTVQPAHAR